MGLVIRVLYNNQSWEAPCRNPGKDSLCWLCFEENVKISHPSPEDEVCKGHCWEQDLRIKYRWGCTPKGRTFGSRAYPGMKVFFISKQPDGNYTMWGKTTVRGVDDKPAGGDREDEAGFAFIHFNPFEPLPRDKWVTNLSDLQLVGRKWLMGRYRYIDSEREAYFEELSEGVTSVKQTIGATVPQQISSTNLNMNIAPNTYEKLQLIANDEGRQIDEIVREAIAEWLRARK
ncbi:MAG TPA: hypothetical protein VMX96_07105 [Dehalococcoidia bacterium]|nr:hypothetical protein [Dehalococcoidia bacterium]